MDQFPLLEPRGEQDFLAELERHTHSTLGGDGAQGGLLHSLLALYAGMLADTAGRLNHSPQKHRLAFLNLQQTPRRPARPSATVAVFEVTEGYNLPVAVPGGALLAAQAEGDPVLYRTKWAFEAIPAKLRDVVWSDSKTDTVRAVFTGEAGERLRPFTLWEAAAPQRGQHAVNFFFEDVFTDEDGCRDLFLTVGLLLNGEPLDSAVLADGSKFCWSIHAWRDTENAPPLFVPIHVKKTKKGFIRLSYSGFPYRQKLARLRLELLDSSLSGLVIFQFCILSYHRDILPEAVVVGDRELNPSDFYPFGNPMQPMGECFLFCGEALFRPGAEITVEFDLTLEEMLLDLPQEPEVVDYKWVMKRPQPKPGPSVAQAFAQAVRFEYWNGATYCALPQKHHSGVDFTVADTSIQLVFGCPADIAQGSAGGRLGCYLRLSSGICEALYKLPRMMHTPHIQNLRFSYHYRRPVFPVRICCENFGEHHELAVGPPVQPFCAPPEGQRLFIGLDTLAHGVSLQLFLEMEEEIGETQPFLVAWFVGEHAQRLPIDDGTFGLTRSGILSITLPKNQQPAYLFGKLRCWLYLQAEKQQSPRMVRAVHLNAQRIENRVRHSEYRSFAALGTQNTVQLTYGNIAQAWVFVRGRGRESGKDSEWERWSEYNFAQGRFEEGFYTLDYNSGVLVFPPQILARAAQSPNEDFIGITYDTCDGARGNAAAYAVDRMQEEIPFISVVYNPLPVMNGEDSETDEQLAARAEHRLYHGGRAVSARDFELIATDLYPQVFEAKCLPGRPVRLALLLRQGGMSFEQIRFGLMREFAVSACAQAAGTTVEIVEAVAVPLTLQVCFESNRHILGAVLNQIKEQIKAFLHPIYGGLHGGGWRMGEPPTYGQITAYIAAQAPYMALAELKVLAQGGGLFGDWSAIQPGEFHVLGKAQVTLEVRQC